MEDNKNEEDNILNEQICEICRDWQLGEDCEKCRENKGCVEVTNHEGSIYNFYVAGDYINNQGVDKGLIGIGNALHKSKVSDFSIIDTDSEAEQHLLDVKQEDYVYIRQPMTEGDKEDIFESTTDIEFTVKKADLQGNSQWEIFLDQRVIRASIEDEDWLRKVKVGQVSINAQKVLSAKLKTTCLLDKYGIPRNDTFKYHIIEIYSCDEPEEFIQIEIKD